MAPTFTVRFFLTRLLGLAGFVVLYLLCFGSGKSPNPRVQADEPDAAVGQESASPPDNDNDRLQALLNSRPSGSGTAWTGLQTFRITKPLVIELDRVGPLALQSLGPMRLIMEGPGPALRIIGTHHGTADPHTVQDNVWQRQRMPLVDGLEILGRHPDAVGMELDGTMQAILSRVTIRDCKHGIHLVNRNRNVLITACQIYENSGIGIFLDDVNLHQIDITGSHISYNRRGGVVSRGGNVRNLHITGCDLESNQGADTNPTANVLIDCSGSPYGTGEVAITGCTIQHNSKSPDSANIRILGRSEPNTKQDLVREGNITITGNILSDVSVNVHLRDCRGVTMTGNTFWMGYDHNLLIEDCTHIVTGSNNLDRNPRYAYGNAGTTINDVVIRNCRDCTFSGLHVSKTRNSPAGITFTSCQWLNISGCTILDCEGSGLLLSNCEHCLVSGCLIRSPRNSPKRSEALVIQGGKDNRISPDNLIVDELQSEGGSK